MKFACLHAYVVHSLLEGEKHHTHSYYYVYILLVDASKKVQYVGRIKTQIYHKLSPTIKLLI